MKIQRVVMGALAEGQKAIPLGDYPEWKAKGVLIRTKGPLVRNRYIALLARGEEAEVIAVWDRRGRPVWASPRIVEEEKLHRLVGRAAYYVSRGSWRSGQVETVEIIK